MFSAGTSFLASCNCSELISNSKVGPSFSSLFDHSLRRCYRFPTGIGIRISGRLYGEPSGRSKAAKECHVARSSIQAISSVSKSGDSKATRLRNLLESPGIHLGPACFNALSAKLVERAGFDFGFTTGFGISAAQLGLPDTGLITYGEMVAMGQEIARAVSIPLIGDADNGYGNAMNVKRTVKGYIHSGYAGILLEDQDLASGKMIGSAREEDGLYIFDEGTQSSKRGPRNACLQTVSFSNNKELYLLHYKLGHPNFYYLKKMFPQLFLNKDASLFHCDMCALSKHILSSPQL